jgi:hypothetical protein
MSLRSIRETGETGHRHGFWPSMDASIGDLSCSLTALYFALTDSNRSPPLRFRGRKNEKQVSDCDWQLGVA